MDLYQEAIERFMALFATARELDVNEPTAVTLSSVDTQGRPSSRTVLLKAVDARGLVFFTNSNSRKGHQLLANPNASLCFFWPQLMQQVLVDGEAVPVEDGEADSYWRTRSRASQVSAWASHQSERLEDRETLTARVTEFTRRFTGVDVPRPPFWSGFRLAPRRIEFWEAGWSRLHERTCYERARDGWQRYLLNP